MAFIPGVVRAAPLMEAMGCIKARGKTLIKPINSLDAEQTTSLLARECFLSLLTLMRPQESLAS